MSRRSDNIRARVTADPRYAPTHHPVAPATPISNEIIEINHPEMFASADKKVISWAGEHYYKSCGETVFEDENHKTTCLKREGHPSQIHEDYDGRTRSDDKIDFSNHTLESAVYDAVHMGAACWSDTRNAGDCDTERLQHICDALLKRIREAGPIYG